MNILPGKDGLLHISEIAAERTEDVNAVLSEGQEIDVKLIGFDRGKMKLSVKALAAAEEAKEEKVEEVSEEETGSGQNGRIEELSPYTNLKSLKSQFLGFFLCTHSLLLSIIYGFMVLVKT